MEFNKAETIRNLKTLEIAIMETLNDVDLVQKSGTELTKALDNLDQTGNDLAFVRILIDKVECGQITEFPLVEKTNFMTGEAYLEEPDRPRCCSPSTELFWTM